MAALRRYTSCLRYVSYISLLSAKTHCQNAARQFPRTCSKHGGMLTLVRKYSENVATNSANSSLESVLVSGSLDEVMKMVNSETDMIINNHDRCTVTREEVEKALNGVDVEEICYIETPHCYTRSCFYIRCKNENSLAEAVNLARTQLPGRADIHSIKESLMKFVPNMARARSLSLQIDNFKYEASKEDMLKWLSPVEVKDLFFIKRGKACIEFKNEKDRDEVFLSKNNTDWNGRVVYISGYIRRDVFIDIKTKYGKET